MSAFLDALWHGFFDASWIEQTATVLGLLGVWLATRQSLANFPIGLVQVVLAAIVFAGQRLYADMSLQGVYFIALVYGWWCWTHPNHRRSRLPVTRLGTTQLVGLITLGLIATAGWGALLARLGDPMPWRDAFIAAFGVLSQWLEARKKIEAWGGWVVVNIAGLAVYTAIGLYWFVFLYSLYLVLSFIGLRSWSISYRQDAPA
ncbi:nicotinamide riboside transporter PnuC [Salinisphaera hydrothermalis]|uniref:Nicotinamide riboside transporter PnuC n=1 Tax=Salinisphaera hydrothermalis (strain C41B8) TaxID=1304275 RepID=A0A084IQJ9_SALHC|nr:nicotinamide riboside transporter PnuC [Salinisphaera hydrothermalis]KEZ78983.1 nicotinamide mononucleotide transporter PnuC [Salinisphaera hydrothermalis C41B8]